MEKSARNPRYDLSEIFHSPERRTKLAFVTRSSKMIWNLHYDLQPNGALHVSYRPQNFGRFFFFFFTTASLNAKVQECLTSSFSSDRVDKNCLRFSSAHLFGVRHCGFSRFNLSGLQTTEKKDKLVNWDATRVPFDDEKKTCILLNVCVVCSIGEYFYELQRILTNP